MHQEERGGIIPTLAANSFVIHRKGLWISEQENKTLVRRYIEEVYNKGNLAEIDEAHTTDTTTTPLVYRLNPCGAPRH